MWSNIKTLNNIVTDVLNHNRIEQLMDFEAATRRHRSALLTPMSKPAKSADDRNAVKKADVEPIAISGLSQRIILTPDIIEETCALSDFFDLNEITTLELLLTAEGHQTTQSSGLRRVPLAITLFYDSFSTLAGVLNTIIQKRTGRLPSNAPISRDVEAHIANFADDLWQSGLLKNLLTFLSKFDAENELKRLRESRLIDARHIPRDITRHLVEIRNRFAECLMLWAVQTPLSSSEISQVLHHLVASKSPLNESDPKPLDHADIHLLMSLLFSIEPFGAPGVTIDQYAEADERDLQHPLFSESGYVKQLTRILSMPENNGRRDLSFREEGIRGLLQMAWATALQRTAHLRADLRRRKEDSATTATNDEAMEIEELVSTALASKALEFLNTCVLGEAHFVNESTWVHRVHGLLTELLINFSHCVRQLRLWDESVARRTGSDPGAFAVLLAAVARLYDVAGSPLHARLALEFWWPSSSEARATPLSSAAAETSASALNVSLRVGEVEHSRQAILSRFVCSTSEFATTPIIFVPYVKMLRALVGCQTSASLCFNLLKGTASSRGSLASILTWDHFVGSLHQYLDHLKRATTTAVAAAGPAVMETTSSVSMGASQPLHLQHPHLYNQSMMAATSSDVGEQSFIQHMQPMQWQMYHHQHQFALQEVQELQQQQAAATPVEIQPGELEAIRAVIALITRICIMDAVARQAFACNAKWSLVATTMGLITCPLPLVIKADLLHLLAALSRSPDIAADVWCALIDSRLLSFIDSPTRAVAASSANVGIGLHTELDKSEARLEEYPITQAFITLLTTLAPSLLNCVGPASGEASAAVTINPCEALSRLVQFTVETIFLKHTMRAYRRPNEKWEVAANCVVFFEGLVRAFLWRMRTAAMLASGAANSSEDRLTFFDWATLLPGNASSAKLNLPHGWPFTDPGYYIVTQLLTNSSLFSLMTGLLEVGLYFLLDNKSSAISYAMVRTTAAVLRLFESILPHEQMLVGLVRRAALVVPHLRSQPTWSQKSCSDVIMPMALSRLLVLSTNSRTCRADLLLTVVRYCGLSEDLPDHCKSALNILYSVVRAMHPHESILAVFREDKVSEEALLRALVSCLNTTLYDLSPDDSSSSTASSLSDFSENWLFADLEKGYCDDCVSGGCYPPHPSFKVAHALAAFPVVPSDWDTAELTQWEFMANLVTPQTKPSAGSTPEDAIEYLPLDAMWAPETRRSIRSTMLNMILYSLVHHPTPSIAHWLLGFRAKNARSISLTTLQDAGVGGFPRTCLHALLDLIELSVASLRENAVADTAADQAVPGALLVQQWDAAVAWQVLYHLLAAPATTAVPVGRYLRGNHDLIARHLTTGLIGVVLAAPPASQDNVTAFALQSVVLNQCAWLLKMAAIDVQASTSQRSYLARLLSSLFAIGEGAADSASIGAGLQSLSFIDCLSSAGAYSDSEQQPGVLANLIARMVPSEALLSPQWIFERDCADSKLMEDIIIASEEPFRLISKEEQAVVRSGVINTSVLAARLAVFLTEASHPAAARLSGAVLLWARRRNTHRLALVGGKQTCLEGWRHLTEIGLRMLHFLARAAPDTLALGSAGSAGIKMALYSATMNLLKPLLLDVSAPESAPAALKVLASGSALSFSAFLQVFASPSCADGPMLSVLTSNGRSRIAGGNKAILGVLQLLAQAVLTSKPTQQRVRSNYYSTLCYVLDVCRQFDQQVSATGTGGSTEVSLALQAVNILAGGGVDADGLGCSAFLAVLFNDITSGHHPIVPISALGLLCLLVKMDRTSGQVLDTVVRDNCLQYCVDSLEEDLAILQEFLISQHPTEDDDSVLLVRDTLDPKKQTQAVAVFYVFQSKMALLTLAASTPLGAKLLVQTPLLDTTLCRFEPLSSSCLADALNFSVANARNVSGSTTSAIDPSDPLSWLDTYEFSQLLLDSLNCQETSDPLGRTNPTGIIDPLVTSRLLSESGSPLGASPEPGQCLTWTGLLMPTLSLAKALAFTLGPAHVLVVQKVSKLLYKHSDALLTAGSSAAAMRLVGALTQEGFQDDEASTTGGSGGGALVALRRQEQLVQATLQWLQGEESLIHLLSFIMRSRIPPSAGGSDDLPREVLRSKTLRHVFSIMSGLLQTLQTKDTRGLGQGGNSGNNARQTFIKSLVTTKQLGLLRLLVSTCVAAVLTEDDFDVFDSTFMKNLIFSSTLSSNDVNGGDPGAIPTTRPGLHLLFQLVGWSASRLHQLEGLVHPISRHLPASLLLLLQQQQLDDAENGEVSNNGKSALSGGQLSLDKVLRILVQLPITVGTPGGEVTTDSLRQIASSVYSLWTPVMGPLLQTSTTNGVDASQRNSYLVRFISLGGYLLQTQLTCLIDILEQSSYLLWRHLVCFLACLSKSGQQQQPSLSDFGDTSTAVRRSANAPRRLVEPEFAEQLPRKLTFDLLDSITQVSKAPYLSSNDQLFLQVMAQRLDRLSQTRSRVAAR